MTSTLRSGARLSLIGLLFALVGAGAAPAAESALLRASSRAVNQVGPWAVAEDPTLGGATRAFGKPNVLEPTGAEGCRAHWRKRGLSVRFRQRDDAEACAESGRAQRVVIAGMAARRWGWHTWRGVRVGATAARVRARHPRGRRVGRSWWIRIGRRSMSGCGGPGEPACPASGCELRPAAARPADHPPGCPVPRLKATLRERRVASFVMWVGAADD